MTIDNVSISSLNIASASKDRARRILDEWIAPRSADIFVLTEISEGPGTQLIVAELRTAGWEVFLPRLAPNDRGVLVATRIVAHALTTPSSEDPAPGRCVIVDFDADPVLQLVAMYVPNRGNDPAKLDRKRRYLNHWLKYLRSTPQVGHRLLVGDLNVVPPTQQPVFLPQQQFEYRWYTDLLDNLAMYDIPKTTNQREHEPTWVAYSGEGYTYDHVFANKELRQRIQFFHYDHTTRETGGITDHSALELTVHLERVNRLHEHEFFTPVQAELF